jgi:hypothetical protein
MSMMADLVQQLLPVGNGPVAPQIPQLIDQLTGRDKDALLDKVEKWFKQCREDRLPFEREWYLNMAFYFGRQNVTWANTTTSGFAKLVEPKAPSWRTRMIVNRIKPTIRKEMAKLLQERPRGFVIPSSSDDADLAAAHAGDAIHEHVTTQDIKFEKVLWNAIFWMGLTGNGFIKDWWDDQAIDASGVQGKIMAEAVSPFHILVPDLDQTELEMQPYVIHSVTKNPEWVKDVYGVDVDPDTLGNDSGIETQFYTALGIKTDNARKKVVVKECWIKPCGDYPKGMKITWANKKLLEVREGNPYAHNQYPFTKIDHIPTGRFYSQSTIVDLIPIQREYNRTRSQIIEAKNRMSKPQLVAPEGSVNPAKITSEPGLIIFYMPGMQPPQPLPLQALPSYVLQELDRSIMDMNDISSQHEVSRGQVPPNVEAATAIAYLQEQDDTVLAHTLHSIEQAAENLGRHVLSHANQFWDAERTISVTGRNNVFESFVFSQADLRGNTAYKVVHGSSTPRSRAAKQAWITELMKLGFIPPDRGLQYLEMAETSKLYEEMQIDVRHAQRENLMLSQGKTDVVVNDFDNNIAHLTEHWAYMKRQEFEQLPDETKMLFMMHCEEHKMQLSAEMGVFLPPQTPFLNGFVKQMLGQIPPIPGMMGGGSPAMPEEQTGGAEQQTAPTG